MTTFGITSKSVILSGFTSIVSADEDDGFGFVAGAVYLTAGGAVPLLPKSSLARLDAEFMPSLL